MTIWVYYEPNIKNNLPDFIIIAPDLGVIIIEVKGWRIKDLRSVNNNEVTVNYGDGEKVEIHPLRQALDYQWKLSDLCKKNSYASFIASS